MERRTVNRGDGGSIPPTTILKLRQFRSPHICLCLSEDTLKAGGPFYLVSMPGEVKSHTGGKCVTCSGLTNSRELLSPSLSCLEETTCDLNRTHTQPYETLSLPHSPHLDTVGNNKSKSMGLLNHRQTLSSINAELTWVCQ